LVRSTVSSTPLPFLSDPRVLGGQRLVPRGCDLAIDALRGQRLARHAEQPRHRDPEQPLVLLEQGRERLPVAARQLDERAAVELAVIEAAVEMW
jgi:hypothetical protein